MDGVNGTPGAVHARWRDGKPRKTLRVAHLTPAYFSPDSVLGGGERYVYYLAHCLRGDPGFRQCVFTVGPDDRLFGRDGIPVRVLRNESPLPDAMDGFSSALWRELSGFDLVHLHQCLTTFGAYSLAITRSMGIATVGTDLGGGGDGDQLMTTRRGMGLLDGVVSISRYAHNMISSFFTGPHEVLIGPVDTNRFTPVSDGGRRDPAMVLCVSRIMPHKGIDRVIAALPPGLRLVVAGRVYHPDYYARLQQMAQGKDVTFIHDADDDALLDLYRSAGLFVQASTARDIYGNTVAKPELMGLTTLEAMACGLPAAVSDTGSLAELVPDDRFGRVFRGDVELAALLLDVEAGRWPSQDAAALARYHVVKWHGMDAIGCRLADFYLSVLAAPVLAG